MVKENHVFEIQIYEMSSGKRPFSVWYKEQQSEIRQIVSARIRRVEMGLLGDCKSIRGSNGIFELRINTGPGLRIYFGMSANTIVVLLCGGDKNTQSSDIKFAKKYWIDWKENE